MGIGPGQGVPPEQGVAMAALAGVDEPAAALLAECFRQFGISTVAIASQDISRLSRERFDAFVLPLDAAAEPVLTAIRRSPENMHAVIYGCAGAWPRRSDSPPTGSIRFSCSRWSATRRCASCAPRT